jgi:hypothetical protein
LLSVDIISNQSPGTPTAIRSGFRLRISPTGSITALARALSTADEKHYRVFQASKSGSPRRASHRSMAMQSGDHVDGVDEQQCRAEDQRHAAAGRASSISRIRHADRRAIEWRRTSVHDQEQAGLGRVSSSSTAAHRERSSSSVGTFSTIEITVSDGKGFVCAAGIRSM